MDNEYRNRLDQAKMYFDPEQMEKWSQHTPEQFFEIMLHELVMEKNSIQTWLKLIEQDVQSADLLLTPTDNTSIPLLEVTKRISTNLDIMDLLLKTYQSYLVERNKMNNQSTE